MKYKKNATGLYYHRPMTPPNAAGIKKRLFVQCTAEYNSVPALEKLIREAVNRHVDGKFTTSDTFRSYVKEKFFVDYPPAKNLAPSSVYMVKYCLGAVCDTKFGSIPLAAVDASSVSRLVADLCEASDDAGERRFGDRTVNMMISHVNTVLRWAVAMGDLKTRPDITRPKVRESEKALPYTPEEAEKLIAAAENEEEHAVFLLMFDAGLRRGEILGLQWPQVDFERHILLIDRQVYHAEMRPTKSGRARRLPMSLELEEALSKIRKPQRLLFAGDGHLPRSPKWLYRIHAKACEKAGVRRTTVHGLRHAFASAQTDDGVSAFALQKLLGHSDIRTTQIYVHPVPVRPRSILAIAAAGKRAGR